MTAPEDGTTEDRFLGGRVTLVQPRAGHRAGLDAALLQACVPADATGSAVDLGTGIGSVALALAARVPGLSVAGVDNDAAVLALAVTALELPANRAFAGRVRMVESRIGAAGDVPGMELERADWVLMNPPFDGPGRVSASPHAGKRAAYLADPSGLRDWIAAAARLLRARGQVAIIHRAASLPTLLAALSPAFGAIRVLPVHPRRDAAAKRVLVCAVKGSRGPLAVLPGLVLHEAEGAWTPDAAALLAGDAALPF